jgi:hypothetical protein
MMWRFSAADGYPVFRNREDEAGCAGRGTPMALKKIRARLWRTFTFTGGGDHGGSGLAKQFQT